VEFDRPDFSRTDSVKIAATHNNVPRDVGMSAGQTSDGFTYCSQRLYEQPVYENELEYH